MQQSAKRPALPALTGIRFVAAFAVVVSHFRWHLTPASWWHYLAIGEPAVGLFFILSGFILTYTYAGRIDRLTWSEFIHLRLARVLPMHVFGMIAVTPFAAWFVFHSFGKRWAVASWLLNLALLQPFVPRPEVLWQWNGPAWSIACELIFYALFPFILPLLSRLRSAASILIAMAVAFVAEAFVFFTSYKFVSAAFLAGYLPMYRSAQEAAHMVIVSFPLLRIAEFVIGILAGLLFLRHRNCGSIVDSFLGSSYRRASVITLTLLISAWLLVFGNGSYLVQAGQIFIFFVPSAAVVLLALAWGPSVFTKSLSGPILVLLGEASYSLYLLHYAGFYLMDLYAGNNFGLYPAVSMLVVAGLIALSLLAFHYVETPLRLHWRKRTIKVKNERAAHAAA